MEDGSFSGKICIDEPDYSPAKRRHFSLDLNDDTTDTRINVIKEYISKVPNATLKQLKSALSHFSDFTDNEFKHILKEANVEKFNELFRVENEVMANGVISTETIPKSATFNEQEVSFLKEKIATCNDNKVIYNSYKLAFPNSLREYLFVKDFKYIVTKRPSKLMETHKTIITSPTTSSSHVHVIHSLYKAGVTPEMIPRIKPVMDELIAQNCNQEEINLAIAYLKA